MRYPFAKKTLGQHFLTDQNIAGKIVDALLDKIAQGSCVLEIGPGTGALTKILSEKNIQLQCVELDQRMIEFLENNIPAMKNKIHQADFLTSDFAAFYSGEFSVIGNFPYNISSQILFRILKDKEKITTVVGMFQKEMADRVAASHGSKIYGIISVLIQAYYNIENLFTVEPDSFSPPPNVRSAVIRLTRKSEMPVLASEKYFSAFVKSAFSQRRKTMRNSLSSLIRRELMTDHFFDRRAETVSVEEFISTANYFYKLTHHE